MDPERQRIQDDLRGLIRGEVRCDDVFVQLIRQRREYLSRSGPWAWSCRATRPTSWLACTMPPRSESPVQPRGAGTGLAGESLGRGLIIDFSRYMRRMVRTEEGWVRIQPGMVHALLNQSSARPGAAVRARSGDESGDDDGQRRRDRCAREAICWLMVRPGGMCKVCKSCSPTGRCWKSDANRSRPAICPRRFPGGRNWSAGWPSCSSGMHRSSPSGSRARC